MTKTNNTGTAKVAKLVSDSIPRRLMRAEEAQGASQYGKRIFGLLLFAHLIVILLFFDAKMSIGGDDSDYIIAAHNFWNGLKFPSWHGPFYPIILSVFTPLFHFNILAYKLISILLALAHFFLLYKTFNNRVPQSVLFFLLIIICINWQLAYYLSTTYSEVLFMFLQGSFLCLFFWIEDNSNRVAQKKIILCWLALGVLLFMLTLTRNNGIGGIVALGIYLVLHKRWKDLMLICGIFIALQVTFTIYKNAWWDVKGSGLEDQLKHIAYRDFYDPGKGNEDLKGFVTRFWINSVDYLSHHLSSILGFRKSDTMGFWWSLSLQTIIFYVVFASSAVLAFKNNKAVLMISIYLFVMMGITFITMQTQWSQERLILVYLPLICVNIGFLIYAVTKDSNNELKTSGKMAMGVVILIMFLRMVDAPKTIATSITNLTSERNAFKGYEDEWKNYVLASEWAGKNIDKSANILCRKPSLSTVYGERPFIGISTFHDDNADSAISFIEKRNIAYILYDDLPITAAQVITKHYLSKRPLGLKSIKKIGDNKSASLLKICYDEPQNDDDYFERLHTGRSIFPKSPYFYLLIGDRLVELGRFSEAIPYYDKVCELAPNHQSLIKRGWAYFQMKNYKKSYDDVMLASKQQPDDQEYKKLLNEIRKRLPQ